LAETQNNQIIEEDEIVPLINVRRSIRDQQSCGETLRFNFYFLNFSNKNFSSQTTSESLTLKTFVTGTNSNFTPGKMRHDIPHRWKRQFVTMASVRIFTREINLLCRISYVRYTQNWIPLFRIR